MEEIKFSDETKFNIISYCFKKCINSFKEKPLSPYE